MARCPTGECICVPIFRAIEQKRLLEASSKFACHVNVVFHYKQVQEAHISFDKIFDDLDDFHINNNRLNKQMEGRGEITKTNGKVMSNQ